MITSVELRNFRNHEEVRVEFSPNTTLIYGLNGVGKTSILEAIYYAYRGTSFKGNDRDLVHEGSEWFRIDVSGHDDERRASVRVRDGILEKKFTINGKEYARLPQNLKRPIILFSPDDLLLLSGSPSRRRQYIDVMISQINPRHMTTLRKYERALVQRNKLLKSPACSPDLLFSWNVLLSGYSAAIINARIDMISKLNERLSEYYQKIAHVADVVEVSYSHGKITSQQLLHQLEERYDRDRILGITTVGPHRHDMLVTMNEKPAISIASRGENRTIILALKQIEADYIANTTSHSPLILLDDVFGELDMMRQKALVSDRFSRYQIIVTSVQMIKNSTSKAIQL